MKEFWNNLPTPAKILVWILIALLLLLIISAVIKSFKKGKESIDLVLEQQSYEAQGQSLSYAPSQYTSFANTLINADGDAWYTWGWFNIGTNDSEDAIYGVFQAMNNDLDILKLEQAYKLASGGYTMEEYLDDVFYRSEIEQVNRILAMKGIQRRY